MSHPRVVSAHIRRLVFVTATFCFAVYFWFLLGAPPFEMWGAVGTPISLGVWVSDAEQMPFVIDAVIIFGVMLATQWVFLRPRGQLSLRTTKRGRPMVLSVVAAAMMATLLTTGFVATLLELFDLWSQEHLWPIYLAMGIVWGCWSVVFFLYWRDKNRETYLTKTLAWLFRGSLLEMLIAAPVQAMVGRAKYDCYCEQGSYTGLVLGGTVLVWTFGPGIALLVLHEKHRREPLLNKQVKPFDTAVSNPN